MSGWPLIGHAWAVELLRRTLEGGRIGHAYLLSGPEGVGKSTLALLLAQALNCEQGGAAPCGSCRTCKRIANGNHPDVRRAGLDTQAAGKKEEDAARQKSLSIDTVRAFQQDINLRPYEARRRVFILDNADALSDQAANALLKTLEEPPPFATLILIAHGGDMLATITSRCQILKLRPVPRAEIAAALQQRAGVGAEDAQLLAAWSGGRVGWALSAVQHSEQLQARQDQLDELLTLHAQPLSDRLRWAEERSKEYRAGQQAQVLGWIALWQSWWRDVLLASAGCLDTVVNRDRIDDLRASPTPIPKAHAFLRQLERAAQQLQENVNPQLALEQLVLHLP